MVSFFSSLKYVCNFVLLAVLSKDEPKSLPPEMVILKKMQPNIVKIKLQDT